MDSGIILQYLLLLFCHPLGSQVLRISYTLASASGYNALDVRAVPDISLWSLDWAVTCHHVRACYW